MKMTKREINEKIKELRNAMAYRRKNILEDTSTLQDYQKDLGKLLALLPKEDNDWMTAPQVAYAWGCSTNNLKRDCLLHGVARRKEGDHFLYLATDVKKAQKAMLRRVKRPRRHMAEVEGIIDGIYYTGR